MTDILTLLSTCDLSLLGCPPPPSFSFSWIHVFSRSRLSQLKALMENEHIVTHQAKVSLSVCGGGKWSRVKAHRKVSVTCAWVIRYNFLRATRGLSMKEHTWARLPIERPLAGSMALKCGQKFFQVSQSDQREAQLAGIVFNNWRVIFYISASHCTADKLLAIQFWDNRTTCSTAGSQQPFLSVDIYGFLLKLIVDS